LKSVSRVRYALAAVFSMIAVAPASAGQTPVLDALVKHTVALHDYAVTIDGHEVVGDTTDDRVMRFWYRKPDRAKLEVLKGPAAGTRLEWTGGTKARVRGGIFSWFPIWLDLHDRRITSLRGNTMLRAELEPTLECFVAHRGAVKETPGPRVEGLSTDLVTLTLPGGLGCPADSDEDHTVTRDVLTVAHESGVLLRRERYIGDGLVERWNLGDIKLDAGLTDADFR
jgi:outer membrane lipoprotein-sorting protein